MLVNASIATITPIIHTNSVLPGNSMARDTGCPNNVMSTMNNNEVVPTDISDVV